MGENYEVTEYKPGEKRPDFRTAYIENGSVIDHIPSGLSTKILETLNINMSELEYSILIFGHVKSKKMGADGELGFKDIIKMPDYLVTKEQYEQILKVAPTATLNLIENLEVVQKYYPKQ